ncbi:MAG: hypothetical protein AABW99_02340 [archaeon]
MVNYVQFAAIILAGFSVAIADALVKKTAQNGSILGAFTDKLMLAIFVLYVIQVAFFIYVFIHNWDLGTAGVVQSVFYAIGMVLIGMLAYGETITPTQGAGMALALIGIVLMNL